MKLLPLLAMLLLLVSACSNSGKSPAAQARDNAITSMADSLKATEERIEQNTIALRELNDRIGVMLDEFTTVNNPRQVEGYTILKSWNARYPLQSTGIVARILESEGFELVAANSSARFDQICVETADSCLYTKTVPYDQAMNYRRGNLTTVAFQGALTDSIGFLVKAHQLDKVTLSFLENGKKVASQVLDDNTKSMLATTWTLWNAQHRVRVIEREIPLLGRKAQAYKLELERVKASNPDSVRESRK